MQQVQTTQKQISPLNDVNEWLRTPAYEAPLSKEELASVQREVDSIIGTTRGGKSIAIVIWNGDPAYWKTYYDAWNGLGKPTGELKRRPHVLFQSIFDAQGNHVRDAFPPRYLVLTRLEPEQYVPTWARDSRIWCPERQCDVQIKPEIPPKDLYLWFQTISEHNGHCCRVAANYDMSCFGLYAHPRAVLENLRDIRKGMEQSKMKDNDPFASADEVTRRVRENSTNNYEAQALKKFEEQAKFAISETPLALAPTELIVQGASLGKIRSFISEQKKREMDSFERKLRGKI